MPVQSTYLTTQVSYITEIVQSEDDGSFQNANATGLDTSIFTNGGIVQANGYIGDGPFGGTTGDSDAFRVELGIGWTLRVDVDASAFFTDPALTFDPLLKVYASNSTTAVATNDDDDGRDSYLSYTNTTGLAQSFVIFLSDLQHPTKFASISGSSDDDGPITSSDVGPYRILINTFDPANGNHGSRIVVGSDAGETLTGGVGFTYMEGKAGNDTLNASGAYPTVFRWDMADGNDTINGLPLASSALDVIGNELGQTFSIAKTVPGTFVLTAADQLGSRTVTLSSVKLVDIHGGGGNDFLTVGSAFGSSDIQTFTFFGDGGNNTLNAAGSTTTFRVFGGDGDDTLFTGDNRDTFYGNDGNDYMNGGGDLDTLVYASIGRDLNIDLNITTAQNTSGAGVDTIVNIENVVGGSGWDTLHGNSLANTLVGGAGNDTLFGGPGAANTLQGGTGNDLYIVEAVGDTVVELASEGTDSVQTFVASFTLGANIENLTFIGAANHTGVGNELANIIIGGTGNDYLVGLAGNDVLIDGSGLNTLQGGQGDDIYAVQSNADSVFEFANEGIDQVQTFLASYTLSPNVENLTFVGAISHNGTGNALNNVFVGNSQSDTFTGAGGSDTFVYRTANPGIIDTITDFNADNANAAQHDHIDLAGRGLNFASLSLTSGSGGTLVAIPGGDAVYLQGVAIGTLDAGDFFFA